MWARQFNNLGRTVLHDITSEACDATKAGISLRKTEMSIWKNERGGCASSSVTTLKPDLHPKLHLPRRPQREDSRSWASAGRGPIDRGGAVHFSSAAIQYAA